MLCSCISATPAISYLKTLRQLRTGSFCSGVFFKTCVKGMPVHSSITRWTWENSSITSYSRIIDGCRRSLKLLISLCTVLATSSDIKFFLLYDLSASWALVALWMIRLTIPKAPAPICIPSSKSLRVNAYSSGFYSLVLCRMLLNFLTNCSLFTLSPKFRLV